MKVTRLRVVDFKNIEAADCSFSPKLNCFVGLNGMGKTNLLDALHYLSFVRSHRTANDSLVVRRGAESSILEGAYETHAGDTENITLSVCPGKKKILKRNKKEYRRLSEHIGRLPLVIISPQDFQLIQGASEERRRFVDQLLSQESAVYLEALIRYDKGLQQRNAMLKSSRQDPTLMAIVEEQMGQYGGRISHIRAEFIQEFIPVFNEYYARIGGHESVSLAYTTSLCAGGPSLEMQLQQSRERDKILGFTTVGIHRDELEMRLDGDLLRRVGSQGQRKSFLISLKLAQFSHLCKKSSEKPILLLDDIFDKLDAERVARIMHLVGNDEFGQIFITDTNRTHLDAIIREQCADYCMFTVENGQIYPEK